MIIVKCNENMFDKDSLTKGKEYELLEVHKNDDGTEDYCVINDLGEPEIFIAELFSIIKES